MISSVPTSLRPPRRRGRGRAGRNDPSPKTTPRAARQRPRAARQHRAGRPSLAPSVAVPTDRREVRMALGKRLSLIFKAKASKALDRAEDPRETLDYSYEKQLELLLIGVVERLPRVLGAVKRLARLRLEDQRQSLAERHTHFPPVGWHRHARCQARSTGPMLSCDMGSLSCGLGRVDRRDRDPAAV